MKRLLILAAGVLLGGCPAPAPDDPSADEERAAALACANLLRLGCPEGAGSVGGLSCARVVVKAAALRSLPLACWTSAESIPIARGCGSLRCIR